MVKIIYNIVILYSSMMNYENYADLNNAKKQIMNLLKTKYGDIGEDYEEQTDTDSDRQMNNIIKFLNDAITYSFQMIPFIKKEADKTDKRNRIIIGQSNYRNANALLSFNQFTLNLSNTLTNLNRIFKSLISNIGYVEPQTIDLYNQSYDKYVRVYSDLERLVIDNMGQFKIKMKAEITQDTFEYNISREFNNVIAENRELVKYNDIVKHTYNFKNNTVLIKKNKPVINDNQISNDYLYDSD